MMSRERKPGSCKRFVLSLLLGLLIFATSSFASGDGNARSFRYHEVISGAAAPSSFDIDGDGVKAHYVTFAGRSTFGPVHGAMLVEYDLPSAAPDPGCPAGALRVPILVSTGNRGVTGTASLLFMRDDAASALFCLDPDTGAFTMSLNGTFTGGKGKFTGATGTYLYEGSGNVQAQDISGAPFGGFVLETKGRITLPKLP